ncbi:MAG: 2Fe-2S iron-sulfur cluster binding domain-containing protein [Candidatus Eisenbacteria bacterium]|nr:2Fe-2S iron-sulfur cluster binding domain-containing protein [Candidatus Eisenbacteria bacterium]
MLIEITVNSRPERLDVPPLRRLLDILRDDLHLTGAKEGCGEGECGACAVLLDGRLVNACLIPAVQADGCAVTTIEGLGRRTQPDPVQAAFMAEGAVQCGFCTPGMILAARALLDANSRPVRDEIRAALAGNLCRCTGYESIIRAVERAAERKPAGTHAGTPAPHIARPLPLTTVLERLRDADSPATPIAGATDVMTQRKMGVAAGGEPIDILRVPELHGVAVRDGAIELGAATTLAEIAADASIGAALPALREMALLFGAPAIRNRATLGGNLATASPAADAPPVLLALDAAVEIAGPAGRRSIAMNEFFAGYRTTVLAPGELSVKVRAPVPAHGSYQRFYKVGPRQAQAIAKVSAACLARCDAGGRLRDVRLACGSVAPVPLRIDAAMEFLEGRMLSAAAAEEAARLVENAIQPIDDVRSTAAYRGQVAGNLVARFLNEMMEPRSQGRAALPPLEAR